MSGLTVLIADDSPSVRTLLSTALEEAGFRVVGTARDGAEAVELAQALRPDVVTMDVLMPRLDGLGATAAIMAQAPTRVVIIAAVTEARQADLSMQAMASGALEVIAKPLSTRADPRAFAQQVVTTVRLLSEVPVVTRRWPGARAPLPVFNRGRVDLVAMAASTGGPPALAQILAALPADFPAAILVAQHITEGFTPGLLRWLSSITSLKVSAARGGALPVPGNVYVAPDGCHLEVDAEGLMATPRTSGTGAWPSGDRLLRSVAAAYKDRACGVVLTGMGDDGAQGLTWIKRAGGAALVQDASSSVVYGMPRAAREACTPDAQLPLDEIAPALVRLTQAAST